MWCREKVKSSPPPCLVLALEMENWCLGKYPWLAPVLKPSSFSLTTRNVSSFGSGKRAEMWGFPRDCENMMGGLDKHRSAPDNYPARRWLRNVPTSCASPGSAPGLSSLLRGLLSPGNRATDGFENSFSNNRPKLSFQRYGSGED